LTLSQSASISRSAVVARRRILVMGTAGLVCSSLARRLLGDGHVVCGIDGVTPYYVVALKRRRHSILHESNNFTAHKFVFEDAFATLNAAQSFAPVMGVRARPAGFVVDFGAPSHRWRRARRPRGLCRDHREACRARSKKKMLRMHTGDMPATSARADLLKSLTGLKPRTSVDEGVKHFVEWRHGYHTV